jgi:hypothetical protein
MALQDELTDDEYQTFFDTEKQLMSPALAVNPLKTQWIS